MHDVTFELRHGETLAVVGESGAGKSTLARIAVGFETPDEGTVTIHGDPVAPGDRAAWRRQRRSVQYLYQNPFSSLNPRWSVGEIVAEPLRNFRVGGRARRRAAAGELLEQVALSPALLDTKVIHLSGGQRQRVAIARALALGPSVVVLDEPVSALDVTRAAPDPAAPA